MMWRSSGKNRVDAGTHIEKSHHLRDLMDDIGQAWNEAKPNSAHVDPGSAAVDAIENQRRNGEACGGVSVKVLRPRIVVTIQVILEQRRNRPNDNGGQDCGVAFRKISGARNTCELEGIGVRGSFRCRWVGMRLLHILTDFGGLICSPTRD
jgi:hypothetical protein